MGKAYKNGFKMAKFLNSYWEPLGIFHRRVSST